MLYETLKFIHIVAAAVILGGGILMTTLLASAVFRRNGERMRSVTNIIAWVGPRVFEIGKREFMAAAFEAALVIFAVWAMTAKPGALGDDSHVDRGLPRATRKGGNRLLGLLERESMRMELLERVAPAFDQRAGALEVGQRHTQHAANAELLVDDVVRHELGRHAGTL